MRVCITACITYYTRNLFRRKRQFALIELDFRRRMGIAKQVPHHCPPSHPAPLFGTAGAHKLDNEGVKVMKRPSRILRLGLIFSACALLALARNGAATWAAQPPAAIGETPRAIAPRGPAACPNLNFGAPTSYAMGQQTIAVALGDFNRDGALDAAGADWGADTVSVRLGNGDGTFGAAATIPVGNTPRDILAADVNRDGKLDLLVANVNGNTISVLRGNGNGTFTALASPGVATPQALALGDFNADGKLDLAVAQYAATNQGLAILLGNGNGGFGAASATN